MASLHIPTSSSIGSSIGSARRVHFETDNTDQENQLNISSDSKRTKTAVPGVFQGVGKLVVPSNDSQAQTLNISNSSLKDSQGLNS